LAHEVLEFRTEDTCKKIQTQCIKPFSSISRYSHNLNYILVQFLEEEIDRKMAFIYTWNGSLFKSRQDCKRLHRNGMDVMQETVDILRVQFDGMDQC
jgi:hypothetical protein